MPIEKLRRISLPNRREVLDADEVIKLREDAQYDTGTAFDIG